MNAFLSLRTFLMSLAEGGVFLLVGAAGAALTLLVARIVKRYSRIVLAAALIGAQLFYIAFAYSGDARAAWMTAEV